MSKLSPESRAIQHLSEVESAAGMLSAILDGRLTVDDREGTILYCAKIMEAAGCYIRRANAKGTL